MGIEHAEETMPAVEKEPQEERLVVADEAVLERREEGPETEVDGVEEDDDKEGRWERERLKPRRPMESSICERREKERKKEKITNMMTKSTKKAAEWNANKGGANTCTFDEDTKLVSAHGCEG